MSIPREAEAILLERFGHDRLITLATCRDNLPTARGVNAFYASGAFYVLTDARTQKMVDISANPVVAIAGEWFSAHGNAKNLGFLGQEELRPLAARAIGEFGEWIRVGHVDLNDENTVLLEIRLTDGILFSGGTRYELKF